METQIQKDGPEPLAEIERIADEIRVKIHLAGMDAKDAWRKLEPRLEEAKAHAASATDASRRALRDIAKSLRELADKL